MSIELFFRTPSFLLGARCVDSHIHGTFCQARCGRSRLICDLAAMRQDCKVTHVFERPVLFIFFCILGQNGVATVVDVSFRLYQRFAGLSSVCVRRCIYLYRSRAASFSSVVDAVAGLISDVKRGSKAVHHSLFNKFFHVSDLGPCLRGHSVVHAQGQRQ